MRRCNQPGCNKKVHRGTYMCKQHLKEYRAAYYLRSKGNAKCKKKYDYNFSPEVIARDLTGLQPIQGGLYEGCTYDQIQALKSGDVERLRKLKIT